MDVHTRNAYEYPTLDRARIKEIGGKAGRLFILEGDGCLYWASGDGSAPVLIACPNAVSLAASVGYFWQEVGEVEATIAPGANALFQNSSSNNTAGLVLNPLTGEITVGAGADGVYNINYNITGAEANMFAIYINGVKAVGSVYGSGAGTQQNTGLTLLALAEGDVVSLRNNTSPAAVTLQLAGGTDTDQVVVSIMLDRVAPIVA